MKEKDCPTIVFVASRLQERNFSAISREVQTLFAKEVFNFTESAYKEFELFGNANGYWSCRESEPWFFESMATIAKFLPVLLDNDDLREFFGHMYQKGVRFEGMVPVLEACGLTKQFLGSFAHLFIRDEKMRDWIVANWNFVMPNMQQVKKELRRKKITDIRFDILYGSRRQALMIAVVAFVLGVIIGVFGLVMIIS